MAIAKDAAEKIEVDYDELEPVLDMEEALKDGATLVHPDLGTNSNAQWVFDSGEAGSGGNVDRGHRRRPRRPTTRSWSSAVSASSAWSRSFMEPRSTVVDPTGEQLVMWSATQVPHILKTMLALTLGLPEHKLRVIAPDVGGGFGGKIAVAPEEVVTLLVAQKLGKPVKWTETRSESLLTAHHGRDQIQDLTVSVTKDGKITGLDVKLLADMGAYLGLVGPGVPILGAFMFNAIYKIPAYRFDCTNVFTTKTLTDAYRGAGRPEATFGIERMMDEVALELGMEPMEFRKKNWIKHEEFPFTTVSTLTYDTGNYEAATDQAMQMFDYDGLRREQAERRQRGDVKQLGIGISTFTEMCGLAPSRVLGSLDYGAGGWETASIRMLPTGKVEVRRRASAATARGTRRRSRRSSPTSSVSASTTWRSSTATRSRPTAVSTPTGRARWWSAASPSSRRPRRSSRRPSRSPRTCSRPPSRDLEFTAGRFSVKGTDKGVGIQDVALAVFAAHDMPGGRRARHRRRTRRSTRRTSPTRTAPTCARSRSTPRPGSCRWSSTSASTTSARSSTR